MEEVVVVEAALSARRDRHPLPVTIKERKLSSLQAAATSAWSTAKERDRARRAVGLRRGAPQALRLSSSARTAPIPAKGERMPHVVAGMASRRHLHAKQGLPPPAA